MYLHNKVMQMGNKIVGFSGTVLLSLAAAVSLGASPVNALPSEVPAPVVCNVWKSDVYNVNVAQTAERTFTVNITDLKLVASESAKGDYFVQLPLSPVDVRRSTNVVNVNPDLNLSGVQISQSIISGPSAEAPFMAIDEYLGNAVAPWENVVSAGNAITWMQDMDARSDAAGVQVKPSDFFMPMLAIDDSAGVLQFTVTVPNSISGEVELFNGMTVNFMSARVAVGAEVWEPVEEMSQVIPGCTISIEAGEETKPEIKPEVPTAPKPPARVETAA